MGSLTELAKLTSQERRVWEAMPAAGPIGMDRLAELTGLSLYQLSASLVVLELHGLCRQLQGRRFERYERKSVV